MFLQSEIEHEAETAPDPGPTRLSEHLSAQQGREEAQNVVIPTPSPIDSDATFAEGDAEAAKEEPRVLGMSFDIMCEVRQSLPRALALTKANHDIYSSPLFSTQETF